MTVPRPHTGKPLNPTAQSFVVFDTATAKPWSGRRIRFTQAVKQAARLNTCNMNDHAGRNRFTVGKVGA